MISLFDQFDVLALVGTEAWQTPGLELGIRLSSASFACRDVRWEDKDRSEKGDVIMMTINAYQDALSDVPYQDQTLSSIS